MKTFSPYYFLIGCLCVLMASCGDKMNKRVTLWRGDKIPYGTYYAFNNLHYFFTDATIETSSASPETFSVDDETSSAYIIVGHNMMPSERELRAILDYVYAGNKLFISALEIGENLLDSFALKATKYSYFEPPDSMSIKLKDEVKNDSVSFAYPGFSLENHFTGMDSSYTHVLGTNKFGKPNFIKITYDGGGEVMLHLAPAAFTNFFLLHKENKKYYDLAISAIPDSVSNVMWDDYYRSHINGNDISKKSSFSKLQELLKNEALRWAFWLTLLLFLLIYLFESKRKQKIIPVLSKPSNNSLDFVQTVGQLYYQRRDNKNLAQKMVTHFLAHIRNTYNMSTAELTPEFEQRLAFKTGYPAEEIKDILYNIKQVEDMPSVSDDELLALNNKLDKFYKRS